MGICGLGQTRAPMKRVTTLIILGFLWLSCSWFALSAQAQSAQQALTEWSQWIGEKDQEGAKWVEKSLGPLVLSPACSVGKLDTIQSFVTRLRALQVSPKSGGLHYLQSIAVFLADPSAQGWKTWHATIERMATEVSMRTQLDRVLTASPALLESGLLGESPAGRWQVMGSAPIFGWDSVPHVRWEQAMILGTLPGDSVWVTGVQARWNWGNDRLRWTGGRVEWKDEWNSYALLQRGELRVQGSGWEAEEAVLHSGRFQTPLQGRVVVKLEPGHKPGEESDYPRFESAQKRIAIANIEPGMNFMGGIRLSGAALSGFGSPDEPAELTILRGDTLFMRSTALNYLFTDRGIQAEHVRWELIWEDRAIRHSDLAFRYDRKNKRITVNRGEEGLGMQPFIDTYHAMELEVDAISWILGSPVVEMGPLPGMTARSGRFSSMKFFSKPAYESMRGIEDLHPLVELNKFLQGRNAASFSTQEYASYLRLSEVQARTILIGLARQGFLQMDLEERICWASPKVQDYLHYNGGRKDYDLIMFASEGAQGPQAQMSLLNGRLQFAQVGAIQVSTAQEVAFLPLENTLAIGKDLNFHFDGRIQAGNFDFQGTGFVFDYESFTVQLSQVESVQISVEDPQKLDAYGNPAKQRILSKLEGVTGSIQIDHPTNKSGRRSKEHPRYPIFTSSAPCYVYYDQPHVRGGAYQRDNFYYEVDPFTFPSMDDFRAEDLRLTGTLVSGGVFPDLELPLQWMPDRSLGIRNTTPAQGAPLYGGLATYTNQIQLDFNGLQGQGTIDFRTAEAVGEDWLFLPDSTLGRATTFRNTASASDDVPDVMAQNVATRLHKGRGAFRVMTGLDSLRAFADDLGFRGDIELSGSGLVATGGADLGQATLKSPAMRWKQERILADTLEFILRGGTENHVMFTANQVRADIDLAQGLGAFEAHAGETRVDFPRNQYHAFMDRFRWSIEPNALTLISDRPAAAEASPLELLSDADYNIQSDHPQQAGLRFLSPEVDFDVDEEVLLCQGVKAIPVADAAIEPHEGKVVIRRSAQMDTLMQAIVYADRTTQYHRIFDAQVAISGAAGYTASGKVNYRETGGRTTALNVLYLTPSADGVSRGHGEIPVENGFRLGPAFSYQGRFELDASRAHFTFDGLVQPAQACGGYERNWIQFRGEIDPDDIAIPVGTEPRGLLGEVLNVGVMVARDAPFGAFPAFFSVRQELSDLPLMPVSGLLKFDAIQKRFLLGSAEGFVDSTRWGNWMEVSTVSCEVRVHGVADWPLDWGMMEADFMGEAWVDAEGLMRMKGSMMLDFPFEDKLLGVLTAAVPGWPGTAPVDLYAAGYAHHLRHWVGEEGAEEAMRELELAGQFRKIPKPLQHTVAFTGLNLIWDAAEDAFVSEGPLGLVSMGSHQVFLALQGKLEWVPSRSGDLFRMYLHGDDQNWYFFDYKLGVMNISTTDFGFRDALLDLKAEDRKAKGEKGEKFLYQYLASKKKRDDFVDRFRDFE